MFLGLAILVLYVVVLFHWDALTSLKGRVLDLEGRTDTEARDQIAALKRRVAELEATSGRGMTALPATISTPVIPSAARPPGPIVPTIPQVRPPVSSPVPQPALPKPIVAPAMVPLAEAPSRLGTDASERADSWELIVGSSWLNKIGVLVFVIGVALLLRFISMSHVGPLGRIAIGFALSGGLLASGVLLERRDRYRNYAYGLIAGGWAGIYFTTFAAHAIPAARVIESDVVGTTSLILVAACMIGHSLRYRAQTVTALAYLAAFGPLTSTPLTTFSLVASVPLLVSLVAIAARFGWLAVSVFGLVSSYGLFVLRAHPLAGEAVDPLTLTPYLVLACYWLAFEVADIVATRRQHDGTPVPLFALNAVGLLGAILLLLPAGEEGIASVAATVTGVAFLTTAVVRSRLLPNASADQPEAPARGAFTSVHAAIAVAAALFAAAIDLRFAGPRETALLLFEAELLFVAGWTVADARIRRLAGAVAVVVGFHAVTTWVSATAAGVEATTPVAALAALVWYVNHEWIRRRSIGTASAEELYPWGALLMVGSVIVRELSLSYQGFAGLIVAAILIEAGVRRASGYRFQAYVAGLVGAWSVLVTFTGTAEAVSLQQAWLVLPAAAALSYAAAWRLSSGLADARLSGTDTRVAAGVAASIGTAVLAVFTWRVVPSEAVAPVWAASALALITFGARRGTVGQRWQGYALAVVATVRAVLPVLLAAAGLMTVRPNTHLSAAIVIALLYASSAVGRWALRRRTADSALLDLESTIVGILPWLATASLALLERELLVPSVVPFAWAATAFAILAIGSWRPSMNVRSQAYVLCGAGAFGTLHAIAGPGALAGDAVAHAAGAAGMLYLAALAGRLLSWDAARAPADEPCRIALQITATLLVALLIADAASRPVVTLAWGLQGALLLAGGFLMRERTLRLSGLALLFLCILKLFVYDLRELDALPRIISFVALGLVLLAVSWTYTRFCEQMRRWL